MNAKNLLLNAAMIGLLSGAMAASPAEAAKKGSKKAKAEQGECHGVNACKGKGECGGEGHSCAGKNACKGKGWIKLSKAECEGKDGEFKAESM